MVKDLGKNRLVSFFLPTEERGVGTDESLSITGGGDGSSLPKAASAATAAAGEASKFPCLLP